MKGAAERKRTHALSSPFTGATSRVAVVEEGRSTSFRHHRRRRCREEERERSGRGRTIRAASCVRRRNRRRSCLLSLSASRRAPMAVAAEAFTVLAAGVGHQKRRVAGRRSYRSKPHPVLVLLLCLPRVVTEAVGPAVVAPRLLLRRRRPQLKPLSSWVSVAASYLVIRRRQNQARFTGRMPEFDFCSFSVAGSIYQSCS
ncbi:uncharacterized protein DS421_19g657620 [Arachis hypogaea]|uniref:Uncharacterized protein n=1 Tax=Arachis hypogaea TaxID=3818 RepID=A0A6B9V958_ARAHY|nr:uncharacterized protein DS421_19g657620 [Arachis hypogaea]